MRHRRRCRRKLSKAVSPTTGTILTTTAARKTRRKACDACVEAKVKCCFSVPKCTRCVRKGEVCRYLGGLNGDGRSGEEVALEEREALPTGEREEVSAWRFESEFWSVDADAMGVDAIAADSSGPATSEGILMMSTLNENPEVLPEPFELSLDGTLDPFYTSDIAGLPFPVLSQPPQLPSPTPSVSSTPLLPSLISLLTQYPTLLLSETFESPFLHRRLYDEKVSDMATLPHSSMAICCASAVKQEDSARFVRRAMEVEMQRVIESFVSDVFSSSL